MTNIRRAIAGVAMITVASLMLSGCAIGVSAGANVSVTDTQGRGGGNGGGGERSQVRDPYMSSSTVAAESAIAVATPR
jgi:hypothetical protein